MPNLQPFELKVIEFEIDALIQRIAPKEITNRRRKEIFEFLEDILLRSIPDCRPTLSGSFPLRTYLPESDMDIVLLMHHNGVISTDENSQHILSIFNVLCHATVMNNHNSNMRLKHNISSSSFTNDITIRNVEFVNARTKLAHLVVNNLNVDITINQIGALSAATFLEDADILIGGDHLFKRSLLLIKAWCLHESGRYAGVPLLGAKVGMLSSYALSVLVLYVFSLKPLVALSHPFEVFYMFINTYASFPWDRFAVSLGGMAPIKDGLLYSPSTTNINILHNLLVKHQQHQHTPPPSNLDSNSDEQKHSLPPVGGIGFASTSGAGSNCNNASSTCTQTVLNPRFLIRACNIVDPIDSGNNLGFPVNRQNLKLIDYTMKTALNDMDTALSTATTTATQTIKSSTCSSSNSGSNNNVGSRSNSQWHVKNGVKSSKNKSFTSTTACSTSTLTSFASFQLASAAISSGDSSGTISNSNTCTTADTALVSNSHLAQNIMESVSDCIFLQTFFPICYSVYMGVDSVQSRPDMLDHPLQQGWSGECSGIYDSSRDLLDSDILIGDLSGVRITLAAARQLSLKRHHSPDVTGRCLATNGWLVNGIGIGGKDTNHSIPTNGYKRSITGSASAYGQPNRTRTYSDGGKDGSAINGRLDGSSVPLVLSSSNEWMGRPPRSQHHPKSRTMDSQSNNRPVEVGSEGEGESMVSMQPSSHTYSPGMYDGTPVDGKRRPLPHLLPVEPGYATAQSAMSIQATQRNVPLYSPPRGNGNGIGSVSQKYRSSDPTSLISQTINNNIAKNGSYGEHSPIHAQRENGFPTTMSSSLSPSSPSSPLFNLHQDNHQSAKTRTGGETRQEPKISDKLNVLSDSSRSIPLALNFSNSNLIASPNAVDEFSINTVCDYHSNECFGLIQESDVASDVGLGSVSGSQTVLGTDVQKTTSAIAGSGSQSSSESNNFKHGKKSGKSRKAVKCINNINTKSSPSGSPNSSGQPSVEVSSKGSSRKSSPSSSPSAVKSDSKHEHTQIHKSLTHTVDREAVKESNTNQHSTIFFHVLIMIMAILFLSLLSILFANYTRQAYSDVPIRQEEKFIDRANHDKASYHKTDDTREVMHSYRQTGQSIIPFPTHAIHWLLPGSSFAFTTTATASGLGSESCVSTSADGSVSGSGSVRKLVSSETFTSGDLSRRYQYQWQRNAQDIAGAIRSYYVIQNFGVPDEGIYRCLSWTRERKDGEDSGYVVLSQTELRLSEPPSSSSRPSHHILREGSRLWVQIKASALPPPSYQWLLNGYPLQNQTSATLVVDAVTLDYSGTYICVISNIAGKLVWEEVTVVVRPTLR